MSTISSSRTEANQAVMACRLKWQLQGGEPGSRPLIDLREYRRLPSKLDRLVGKVQLLRICATSEFYKENKSQILSLAGRVNLKCFELEKVCPHRGP